MYIFNGRNYRLGFNDRLHNRGITVDQPGLARESVRVLFAPWMIVEGVSKEVRSVANPSQLLPESRDLN